MGKANNVKLSLEEQATKVCTKCGEEKLLDCFPKTSSKSNKRRASCKACKSKAFAEYRAKNKTAIRQKRKLYYDKNAEQSKNIARAYYNENKELCQAKHREWHKKNRDHVKSQRALYYKKNKKSLNEKTRQWQYENKQRLKDYSAKYYKEKIKGVTFSEEKQAAIRSYKKQYRTNNKHKLHAYVVNRRKNDPVYKLKDILRNRNRNSILGKLRAGSAVRDMGCTGQEACDHLESMFDKNMTWENWGTYWHLDHIFPLARANVEDRAEFLAVSNWRNLQPLEAKANIAKGNKVTPAARRLFNKLVKEFS